jgi:hypothetical protein
MRQVVIMTNSITEPVNHTVLALDVHIALPNQYPNQ